MGQSTKPYLIRAIYDWCIDNGFTPYISVRVISDELGKLAGYVKNGETTINVSAQATPNIIFGDEVITCSARFNGASQELCIPIVAVSAIFSRENGRGVSFSHNEEKLEAVMQNATAEQKMKNNKLPIKPKLQVVK